MTANVALLCQRPLQPRQGPRNFARSITRTTRAGPRPSFAGARSGQHAAVATHCFRAGRQLALLASREHHPGCSRRIVNRIPASVPGLVDPVARTIMLRPIVLPSGGRSSKQMTASCPVNWLVTPRLRGSSLFVSHFVRWRVSNIAAHNSRGARGAQRALRINRQA